MIGPVLSQELLLGSRRGRRHLFRRIYAGWLVLICLHFWYLYEAALVGHRLLGTPPDPNLVGNLATTYLRFIIAQQVWVILLVTPALVAGAITDEKTRGTLQYLLIADVTDTEIVLGKLIGRLAQVGNLLLCALPLVCAVGLFAGLHPVAAGVFFAALLPPLFGVAALSVLASVWARQTRDAVLAVYTVLVLGGAGLGWAGGLHFVDPLYAAQPLLDLPLDYAEAFRRLLRVSAAWAAAGGLCLALSTWRLRPAYLGQLEAGPRRRGDRSGERPLQGDDPLRWKERDVEGVAPMSLLRRVPRGVAVAGLVVLTVTLCLGVLLAHRAGALDVGRLLESLRDLSAEDLVGGVGPATDALRYMGLAVLFLVTLVAAARGSGAVTGEREKQTWEALLLTPLTERDILLGKLRGIVGAARPYLLAYGLPALVLSLPGGGTAVAWVVVLLLLAWFGTGFACGAGIWCSVRCRNSWRSLLAALALGYVCAFFLFLTAAFLAWIPTVFLMLLFMILGLPLTGLPLGTASGLGVWLVMGILLTLVGASLLERRYFLADAVRYVANRERMRQRPVSRPLCASRRYPPQELLEVLAVEEAEHPRP